jgi:DNA-binding Lrp family transcriptional regulator
MNLQNPEKMILNELRKNARTSLNDVAQKASIPTSTVYERVKNYEDSSLIKKHTSILNFYTLGYLSRIMIVLKVDRNEREGIQDFLEKHPNVNTLYRINSGFDYLVEIISKNSRDSQDIVEEIESLKGVREHSCFNIIDEVKKEAFEIQ